MSSQNLAVRLWCEPLRSLAFGSITSTYAGIGTSLANACRQFILNNNTDVLLIFSLDGVTDHFVLAANSQLIDDIGSNSLFPGGSWNMAQGTRLYVRTAGSPSIGAVYFSVFYGIGSL